MTFRVIMGPKALAGCRKFAVMIAKFGILMGAKINLPSSFFKNTCRLTPSR
jgi:hypothetical protein